MLIFHYFHWLVVEGFFVVFLIQLIIFSWPSRHVFPVNSVTAEYFLAYQPGCHTFITGTGKLLTKGRWLLIGRYWYKKDAVFEIFFNGVICSLVVVFRLNVIVLGCDQEDQSVWAPDLLPENPQAREDIINIPVPSIILLTNFANLKKCGFYLI